MSAQKPIQGVTPTKIRKARPASLCSVFIRTICSTPNGDKAFGKATGFHYRSADGGTHALMAMSTQRKTLDFEREFSELKTKLPQSA